MAKPRIFISSTFYDLKHIRHNLDIFIEELGFDPILSEKGDIAYSHEIPLDESCYREVETVDIFVLIIGGRYGSEISSANKKEKGEFHKRYESITKKEFEAAYKRDIPIYILIEKDVYTEYRTYLRNKSNSSTNYAFVDSINIFMFIEDIMQKQRNNPIYSFEKFDQIKHWLRDQWSGLFREFLNKERQKNQIKNLTTEVDELKEINKTLKVYLENLLNKINPEVSSQVINEQKLRLLNLEKERDLLENEWYSWITGRFRIDDSELIEIVTKAKGFKSLEKMIQKLENINQLVTKAPYMKRDINSLRSTLGLKTFKITPHNT